MVANSRLREQATIRSISRECAPDVDGWISQAKQLRDDVRQSQEQARQIVGEAQQADQLEEEANDAANKVALLDKELAFNQGLATTLDRLQALRHTLDSIQSAILDDQLLHAVDLLRNAKESVASTHVLRTATVAVVFRSRIIDLRKETAEKLISCWDEYINVDTDACCITIRGLSDQGLPDSLHLNSVANALISLDLFDKVVSPLCRDLELLILNPRLETLFSEKVRPIQIDGETIRSSQTSSDLSAEALFSDLNAFIQYMHARLPKSVIVPLSVELMPRLISKIISIWLASAVPENLDGIEDFQDTVGLVQNFINVLKDNKWSDHSALSRWIDSIPDSWLRKRQDNSLNQVRKLLSRGLGAFEPVERVETQKLAHDDDVFSSQAGGDDWNAGWSDEEAEESPTNDLQSNVKPTDKEEEEVSAWGLDADDETVKPAEALGDDGESWGWGEENVADEAPNPSPVVKSPSKKTKSNGIPSTAKGSEREITLKETFKISSLPKEILEIITHIISDAFLLESSEYADCPVASAATPLLSLPGLILAMFRASASGTYTAHPSGSMFLYNDSLWLAERLHSLSEEQTTSSGKKIPSRSAYNLRLESHLAALDSHGKRAYAKEMESQRTIITDLLDGAQGFVNCTESPFNQECDTAIASTVDRLRQLHKEWSIVLSQSALLQSLGSLLSSVISKVIVDIEDMADISEPDSQQLAKFCSRIAALENLFTPQTQQEHQVHPESQEVVPLTAVYTLNWLKFQYLANILESSLVDIKYLWTEGELNLEFDKEELVDLIVALFADSPYRREAVGEIRRARR